MKSRWCAMSTRVACQLARVRPCAASYRQGTLAGAEHVAIFDLLYLLHSHQDYDGARTEIVSTSTITCDSVASNTASCIRLAPGAFPASFSIITQPSSPHESSQQLHRRLCSHRRQALGPNQVHAHIQGLRTQTTCEHPLQPYIRHATQPQPYRFTLVCRQQ